MAVAAISQQQIVDGGAISGKDEEVLVELPQVRGTCTESLREWFQQALSGRAAAYQCASTYEVLTHQISR